MSRIGDVLAFSISCTKAVCACLQDVTLQGYIPLQIQEIH